MEEANVSVAESPSALERQIRFELDSLGQTNDHHAFEQLCLGIARRRITSNLMRATGPVSAGGDQARDAESYWSNLAVELPGTSLFTSSVSDHRVVMACTIQQTDVAGKIRNDLATLGGQGGVARVLYFITGPLPVGKRHELQSQAVRDHQIELDVWDANAISAELKEHDLFHLAVTHLHLSANLSPEPPLSQESLPDWYVEDRRRWRDRDDPAGTIGDLVDLERPLRYATYHPAARADLPDWIAAIRAVLADARAPFVVARARYELVAATMGGFGSLYSEDELFRAYFRDLTSGEGDLGVLVDAVHLLEYGCGAWLHGVTSIARQELDGWRTALRSKVEHLLAAEPYPNAAATLLAVAARLALQSRYPDDLAPRRALTSPIVQIAEGVQAAVEAGELLRARFDVDLTFVDLDGGMRSLRQLVERLPDAPFFPIKNTVDHFNFLIAGLVDHPLYEQVRDGLDAAVERLEGESARGDRAQGRAIAFLEAGRRLDALSEVHRAKISWWHGDTIEGAAIMCLLASRIYSELGLPIAAKQYALTAAVAARAAPSADIRILVARGIILAGSYEHQAGMWFSATHTFQVGLLAQCAYSDDPMNEERYPYITDMLVDQAFIVRATQTLRPEYLTLLGAAIERTPGLGSVLDTMLQTVENSPALGEREYGEIADRDGLGRPFSDAGPTRSYSWAALGTTWEVRCSNDRAAVLAAERFVAALQITLAELATHDALLLTGSVGIDIAPDRPALAAGAEYWEDVPNNNGGQWLIHLTPVDALDENTSHLEIAGAVVKVLIDRSLLSPNAFMAIIDRSFEAGLWHKLLSARPYDETADLLEPGVYDQMAALSSPRPGDDVPLAPRHGSTELGPPTTPAPGYSRSESLRAVADRYDNLLPVVRRTVQQLAGNPEFQSTVSRLRTDGWLDWHLLTAVANLAGNERARLHGLRLTADMTSDEQQRARAVMMRPETDATDPLPVGLFTEEQLRFHLNGAVLSTLAILGLSNNQRTPDFDAVFRFLGDRYSYWHDDQPHPPIAIVEPHEHCSYRDQEDRKSVV